MSLEEYLTSLVDLHCHVLPGIDDGAADLEVSLRMLELAQADGVRLVAATPHAHRSNALEIPERVARLNAGALEAGLEVRVVPGQEVRIGAHVAERVRQGDLLTLNGTRFLLLELPLFGEWPSYVAEVVRELLAAKVQPILAHPERYPDVQRDPELVRRLVEMGVPVQINADSLGERAERGARPAAEYLLTRRMAHLIASDSHSDRWRPPGLAAAFRRAAELAGAEYAAWMAGAAWQVIRDEPLTLPSPRAEGCETAE